MNKISEKVKYILDKMENLDKIMFIKDGFIIRVDNKIIKVIYPNKKMYIGAYEYSLDFDDLYKLRQKAIKLFDILHSSRMQIGRW